MVGSSAARCSAHLVAIPKLDDHLTSGFCDRFGLRVAVPDEGRSKKWIDQWVETHHISSHLLSCNILQSIFYPRPVNYNCKGTFCTFLPFQTIRHGASSPCRTCGSPPQLEIEWQVDWSAEVRAVLNLLLKGRVLRTQLVTDPFRFFFEGNTIP